MENEECEPAHKGSVIEQALGFLLFCRFFFNQFIHNINHVVL